MNTTYNTSWRGARKAGAPKTSSGAHGRKTARSHRRQPSALTVNLIVIAICAVALVPLIVIGMYDRPSADDFGYSMLTHQVFLDTGGNPLAVLSAAVQTSANYYNTWQGLYTSAFLLSLQPGIAGSQFYPIGCYLIIGFIVITCLYLAYCVERHALRLSTRFWPAAGALLATLLLQCMPYANEGIYWYNGAANYTPIFFATFVSAGLCITALSVGKRWQRVIAVLLATVVSFVISGGNYMPAFFNLMIMAAFTLIGLLRRKPVLAVPLIASVAGFAISAMAPGTAIRQEILNEMFGHPSIAGTLVHSTSRMLMDLRLFIDLPVLLFFLAVTPLIVFWARRAQVRFSGKVLALATVAAFVFMVGTLCVPYYATGGFGEGRARDAAFFVDATLVLGLYGYAVCWVVNRFAELGEWSARVLTRVSLPVVFGLTAFAVLVVVFYGSSVAGNGNSALAVRSLASGEAQQYAREYDEREAILLANPGGEATIGTLSVQPKLLFFSDVLRNDDDWSDELEKYYGVKSVTIDAPADFNRYVTFET